MNETLSQIKTQIESKWASISSILRHPADTVSGGQDFTSFRKATYSQKKEKLNYRILYPENFSTSKQYPLVFVLHGSGERGNDNNSQLTNGAFLFLKSSQRFPAIVIFPQCSKTGYWSNTHVTYEEDGGERFDFQLGGEPTRDMNLLLGLIDDFLKKPYVDTNRVYAGGLSMGGMGTFELLRRRTDVFAAAFSICGGDNVLNAKVYAQKVPLWIFHGENDKVVSPEFSESITNAIKKSGGKPRYTLYPGVGHDSWNNAFADPQLLPWLFGNSK